jgi:RHS repeat-associated protein
MLAEGQIAAQPVFPLAAFPLLAEKPHPGVASKNRALHQGWSARNSTTALGLSWSWWSGTASGAGVTYDYDAWGNTVNQTGSTPNVYRYRGEQYDPDLNLYYLRARYFSPLTGRFLTRDPVTRCGCIGCRMDPSRLHRYLYADANPVNRLDPWGLTTAAEYTLILGMTTTVLATAAYYENQTHAAANIIQAVGEGVRELECDTQRALDEAVCRLLSSKGARSRCWASSTARWAACMRDQPIPPLVTW